MAAVYTKIEPGRKVVVGIGSALVDIIAMEDEAFIAKSGAVKGGMTLVDRDTIERVLSLSTAQRRIVPGGSACNTLLGVGRLGAGARFVGKCGKGPMGRLFEEDLRRHHVEPALLTSSSPTGRVLSIVTPDAQRSMFTYLGASSETLPSEISNGCFDQAAVVHVEGYLAFNRELILAALRNAKEAGARVSLDLASFTVVEASRDFLAKIVEEYVDILIANEDEALAYTGFSDELRAVEALAESVDIGVLKVGARGSYIRHQSQTLAVAPAGNAPVIDTTGAGDLWAAGFLYGIVNGMPLAECGALASACGYEVCQVMGAKISEEGWQRIRRLLPAGAIDGAVACAVGDEGPARAAVA